MSQLYISKEELERQANAIMMNVVMALQDEDYLTQEQCNEICTHYSVIMEDRKWLPTWLCDWMGLKPNKVIWRLVKAIGRCPKDNEPEQPVTRDNVISLVKPAE